MLNIFSFSKNRKKKTVKLKNTKETTKKSFAAVKIIHTPLTACDAVKSQDDIIYLRSEAPLIPLGLCTNRHHCECKYEHFSDRRQDGRRETDFGLPDRFSGDNRRRHSDRRAR